MKLTHEEKQGVEWKSGDECLVENTGRYGIREGAESFIGCKCVVMAIFETPHGVKCAAVYNGAYGCEVFVVDMLSKPESPEQKAKREREDAALELYRIINYNDAMSDDCIKQMKRFKDYAKAIDDGFAKLPD